MRSDWFRCRSANALTSKGYDTFGNMCARVGVRIIRRVVEGCFYLYVHGSDVPFERIIYGCVYSGHVSVWKQMVVSSSDVTILSTGCDKRFLYLMSEVGSIIFVVCLKEVLKGEF